MQSSRRGDPRKPKANFTTKTQRTRRIENLTRGVWANGRNVRGGVWAILRRFAPLIADTFCVRFSPLSVLCVLCDLL
jgi:hypothetical protein